MLFIKLLTYLLILWFQSWESEKKKKRKEKKSSKCVKIGGSL